MTQAGSHGQTEGVQATAGAGTPSSIWAGSISPAAVSGTTLAQLEWLLALEGVAGYAAGPLGAARVKARLPSHDVAAVRHELRSVAELARLLAGGDPFGAEPVPDLEPHFAVLAIDGGVLDGLALWEIAQALRAMRVVAGELHRIADEAPTAAGLLAAIPPRTLERALERAIGPDGTVQDDASPGLKRARAAVRDARAQLVRLLEDVLRGLGTRERVPDATVTLRSGRYVIPVRKDSRSRVTGLVHGESASGATVFVEPEAAVALANQLAGAEAAEAREVQRVLRELTAETRTHHAGLRAGFEMCVAVDDLWARARFMVETGGAVPEVREAPSDIVLRQGRHPLLWVNRDAVVPFDLTLPVGRSVLVVSGPNAGGKTVLLKAVGLLACLAQAGIVPPVGEGTVLPVFSAVFADIGDHQSIAESLSTFSARVRALRDVLVHADRRSLVLLDEVGGGTDPTEGAALAGACVLELGARGAVSLITTHLTALKELAAGSNHIENGSMEFDGASLTPTFRLLQGVPGRSFGLVVARRLGLPADVLDRAEALVPEAHRSLDQALAEVGDRLRAVAVREEQLARLEERLGAEREGLTAARESLEQAQADVERRERETERSGREQARRFLLEARRRVDEALGLARAAVSEATAREARRLVEEGVRHEAEALHKLDEAARAKGWTVRGAAVSRAPASSSGAETREQRRGAPAADESAAAAFEVDLRGLIGDEAEAALVLAIDRAVMDDLPHLRVIHGKGTGALRSRVQQVARRDRRVASFRLGVVEEGGTGVTIMELKR